MNGNSSSSSKQPEVRQQRRDKSDLGDDFVAPDGGWGWLVALAAGISILVSLAISQQFGIVFRERMMLLGISSAQLTTIINIHLAVASFSGLLNGPIFKRYSHRQVTLAGAAFIFAGILMTTIAGSFEQYIASYACLYGIGRGYIMSAASLVVNTYFRRHRRTATAYQFGVAGLAPIVGPYAATMLVQRYGVQGTVLLFAGLTLHNVPCALIYQPVKWHLRRNKPQAQANELELVVHADEPRRLLPARLPRQRSTLELCATHAPTETPVTAPARETLMQRLIVFFDLDLLHDLTYLNLAVGVTLINFVEINFAVLTPFMLADFGYDDNQIALAMTLLAVCDLIVRFLIPLLTSRLSVSNRCCFVIGIVGMCVGRLLLTCTRNFNALLAICFWLGLNKAFRTVFFGLIIPGYVSLKKLPAASGLQLLLSGIFSLTFGPLIGLVRDRTSYAVTLHIFNAICVVAMGLWFFEDCVRMRLRATKNLAPTTHESETMSGGCENQEQIALKYDV